MKPHLEVSGENRPEEGIGIATAQLRRDGGFTLLELMVATALFACAAVAIALALQSSYRTDLHAQNWTIAYRASQKVMERWLSKDYQDLIDAESAAPPTGIVEDFVVKSSPSVQGHTLIEDIGVMWGGVAQSAFRITVFVDDPKYQIDVRIVTARCRF